MKCSSYELFFDTFSNKTRFRIIETLLSGPKSVTGIAESLSEEQSKVSHALKKLAQCNFLSVKKSGKQHIYCLNKDTIVPILKIVEQHVRCHCKGECLKRLK